MEAVAIAQLISLIFPVVEKVVVDGTQLVINMRNDKTVDEMCADLQKVRASLPDMVKKQ
jgi:hypothetical protein